MPSVINRARRIFDAGAVYADPGLCYSLADAAVFLGLGAPTIRVLIRRGELPAIRTGSNGNTSIRIRRSDLMAWRDAHVSIKVRPCNMYRDAATGRFASKP